MPHLEPVVIDYFKPVEKVLLIGGNGFVGSHVADMLLDMGASVRVLDRYPERFRPPNDKIDYRIGDFSDKVHLESALKNVDTVIHLQSTTVPSTSERNSLFDIESNLIPTIKLLDAMVKEGCTRLIYISSGGAVYGKPAAIPIVENSPLNPISSYGVVKCSIEKYINYYCQYGIQPLILRPSNLYGCRQSNVGVLGLINTLLEKALKQEKVIIFGDGSVIKDYIHIDDMVHFMRSAISKNLVGTYNVGSGIGHSVNDVIDIVEKVIGRPLTIERQPSKSYDVDRIVLAIDKAKTDGNWNPETPMEEGIGKVWKSKIEK